MHGDEPSIRADSDLHDLFVPLMSDTRGKTARDFLGQIEAMRAPLGGSTAYSLEVDPKGML